MFLQQTTKSYGVENHSWLDSKEGTNTARSATLDTSAFTAGTHYPNGYFPSGLPLGRITATGLYGPYDNAATDGRETLAGFLFTTQPAPDVNTIDVVAPMIDRGRIKESRLPVAIDTAGKTDVAGRFTFI